MDYCRYYYWFYGRRGRWGGLSITPSGLLRHADFDVVVAFAILLYLSHHSLPSSPTSPYPFIIAFPFPQYSTLTFSPKLKT